MKCAIFPCLGLGDGLIANILSNNLVQAGHQVDTFHPLLGQLQPLFPHLPFFPRTTETNFLQKYDKLFFFYEKLDWMQNLLQHAQQNYPEKTVILNPIATPNRDYPYWENGRFDGRYPFGYNLVSYCRAILKIKNATMDNGIVLPEHVVHRKFPNRIIIHATSSRAGKNWTPQKFLLLSKRLKKEGYEPVFILTQDEKKDFPNVEAPHFKNLYEVALFIAESGWMVGNDSGIGHLASCLKIPTLTICRSQLTADFWRPAWEMGRVIIPPKWIPNIKGMRWRDKKWQQFVPVRRVFKEFLELTDITPL